MRCRSRMTESQAYELCPPALRRALQDTVSDWSAIWALKSLKRRGLGSTINALRYGDELFMLAGLVPARGRGKVLPEVMSTYVARVQALQRYSLEELLSVGAPPHQPVDHRQRGNVLQT